MCESERVDKNVRYAYQSNRAYEHEMYLKTVVRYPLVVCIPS